ncbi:glycosyl transferase family 1 [Sphingobacteriaceae bacterium]|nr:glycosyl transferase family 1 [Sphingobacteriaceae bacterium]
MRIGIIGTRGIPNNYGGFEQLAQHLSVGLKNLGHEVYVYNSHTHFYKAKTWQGVNIIHQFDPENFLGATGQFVYDFNCILNARKQNLDVILNLGYTSSSVWLRLFPKKSFVITNMDGLEWKRSKYSKKIQGFLKYAEKLAVHHSDLLVADSHFIQTYITQKYGVRPEFIAYGAELFDSPDAAALKPFNVQPFNYNMIVARMEPENNIEMILDGIDLSRSDMIFFVVGNTRNKFGTYLKNKFRNNKAIVFTEAIYDSNILNSLRYYSKFYFHGHSVGGTNPSLLEAMGCQAFIIAHDNEFNRSVLGEDTFYFNKVEDIASLLLNCDRMSSESKRKIRNNYERISENYSWNKIIKQYEQLMIEHSRKSM